MRFKIHAGGSWRGDSYATKPEAEAVAEKLRKTTALKVEVLPKGGVVKVDPEPKK